MIDLRARKKLSQLVRQLAAGTITLRQFEAKSDCTVASYDAGVGAILDVCYVMCEQDGVIWSRRLRGRYRLPRDIRHRLAVSALYLRSDVPYDWPEDDGWSAGPDCLLLLACAVIATVGIVIVWVFPLISVILFALAALIYTASRIFESRQYQRFEAWQNQIGDYDVWPFRRRKGFDEARQHPWLLTGAN